MIEYTALITCDECGDSMMCDLAGLLTVKAEAILSGERLGWQFDGQDLCPGCVADQEDLELE
jgi:hypothetical protein